MKDFNPETTPSLPTGTAPSPDPSSSDAGTLTFDKDLKPSRSALPSATEAHELAKALVASNQTRIDRDALFLRKLDMEAPQDATKLKNSGANWTSNVSSGLLSTIVYRVLPAILRAVNATKYLTDFDLGDINKTNKFNEKLTKAIRSWQGWQDHVWDLAFEDITLGRAFISYGDSFAWKGKFYSTSNALLPEECPQNIEEIPFLVLLDDWLLHEFVEKIKDGEKASGSGWDIDNCVKALNAAAPPKRDQDKQREYVDWITQGAYNSTYTSVAQDKAKPNRVSTFRILAQEPDDEGRVSEMIVTREDGLQLYYMKNKYKDMTEAGALYTYTRGNGTAHGSKGLCRLLINYHNLYDRHFNKIFDDLFLGGCRVMELPEGKKTNAAIRVQQPFIITPPGCKTSPSNININVEAYHAATRQLQGLCEQTAGSYIPSALAPSGKTDKTATEATIDAAQQAEVKEGILGRFLYQFQKEVTEMSRRLLKEDTYDEDAKKLQKELEEDGITREEIDKALEEVSLDNYTEYSLAVRNGKIMNFIKAVGPSPAYNQQKLSSMLAESMVDSSFAEDIVIVKPDPMADVTAINKQQMENAALFGGKITELIPDPLDNDIVHLQVLDAKVPEFIQRITTPNTDALVALKATGAHIVAHIEAAKAKGVKGFDSKPSEATLQLIFSTLKTYANQLERIGQAVTSQLPQQQPGAAPQLPPGAGPVPPAGAI